jgi:hypothetical protein
MSVDETINKIDELLRKYGAENSEVKRQVGIKEEPTYYRKQLENEGRSEWSGGWAAGRTRSKGGV